MSPADFSGTGMPSGVDQCAVPLESLLPLMRAKGVTMAPADFHAAVNLVFHRFESSSYDRIHRNMSKSLPWQFELLVDDYLRRHLPKPRAAVLDVGCGTGLASELLVKTRLRPYIESIDLVDTSHEMLQAAGRRHGIGFARRHMIRGSIDDLPAGASYDFIVVCSVLHHIPDLGAFFRAAASRQTSGGVLMHIQDPNSDYRRDPDLRARREEWNAFHDRPFRRLRRRLTPRRVAAAALRRIGASAQRSNIDRTNDELIRLGVVREPLAPAELWSVTDLREHHGTGISISAIGEMLPEYDLVSSRSYAFWGALESDLPRRFRKLERELIASKAQNGSRVGALWIRKGESPIS